MSYQSHDFLLSAEQPYDSMPNFSAADALRLTGIGRNEFIDIMNKCRSKVLFKNFCTFMCLMSTYVCLHVYDFQTYEVLLLIHYHDYHIFVYLQPDTCLRSFESSVLKLSLYLFKPIPTVFLPIQMEPY